MKSQQTRQSRRSRSPRTELTSKAKSRSRSRSRSRERKLNRDLIGSWKEEMNENRNKRHSTYNKSAINNCSGNSCESIKWHYQSSKVCFGAKGYYEELPAIFIDNIGIAIRVFPLFDNGHSGIGLTLVNKEELMDRVNAGYDEPIGICIALGSIKINVSFELKEFRKKRVVYRELNCSSAVWDSKNRVSFEFTFRKNTFRQYYGNNGFSRKIKTYEFGLKYGGLKIYSVDGKGFDCLDCLYVGRYEDTNNNNNNNNNNN
eukprot:108392_1